MDALFALGQPVVMTCPGPQQTASATEALCVGAAPGESRPGYWVLRGGEGVVATEADVRAALAIWFDAIARHSEASDVYGPGELRIGSISCTRQLDQPSGTCLGNSIQVHFTFINPPDAQGTGTPGERTTFHVSARVVDGVPKLNGFGTVVPLNSPLLPRLLEVRDANGNLLLGQIYPWTY